MAKIKEKNLTFKNKKAYHDYHILETLEAGIMLQGSEVKAIRDSRVNLKDTHIRIIKDEVYVLNMHITHLSTAHTTFRPDERRSRKLLLHRRQIEKLYAKVTKEGVTLIPTKLYFNSKNMVKIEVAVAKGKKLHDKREDLKQKTLKKEASQALKNNY